MDNYNDVVYGVVVVDVVVEVVGGGGHVTCSWYAHPPGEGAHKANVWWAPSPMARAPPLPRRAPVQAVFGPEAKIAMDDVMPFVCSIC